VTPVDREEFREFAQFMRAEMKDIKNEQGEQGKMLAILMDARARVATEIPDAGNFKVTKLHVGIVIGTSVALIAALKFLKVIP
jgi:hypothetical protein